MDKAILELGFVQPLKSDCITFVTLELILDRIQILQFFKTP